MLPSSSRTCAEEILAHEPSAKPAGTIDLDGDGTPEPVYRAGHDLHGNAHFHFCRVESGRAVYLGSVQAFVVSTPHCDPPPANGRICRLSARRRMFHDDYQEWFYVNVGSEWMEAGAGDYTPPPPPRKR
jgi:hypothetical protein